MLHVDLDNFCHDHNLKIIIVMIIIMCRGSLQATHPTRAPTIAATGELVTELRTLAFAHQVRLTVIMITIVATSDTCNGPPGRIDSYHDDDIFSIFLMMMMVMIVMMIMMIAIMKMIL